MSLTELVLLGAQCRGHSHQEQRREPAGAEYSFVPRDEGDRRPRAVRDRAALLRACKLTSDDHEGRGDPRRSWRT
jgi:hypothetical protein